MFSLFQILIGIGCDFCIGRFMHSILMKNSQQFSLLMISSLLLSSSLWDYWLFMLDFFSVSSMEFNLLC